MTARPRSPRPAPAAAEVRAVALGAHPLGSVSVTVRRNRRARHVRLHVDELGDVTASVPARFDAARLDPIVRDRADWLQDVLARMELKARDTQVDLLAGDPVRWLGQWLPTRLVREGRRAAVQVVDGQLELRVPQEEDPHDALVAWYRREARAVFEERVAHWCELLGLTAGKVSIREQRTRWGSCTHRGDLSFNWRLVLAPAWVLDSIVVHEICHIEELNHSERFWALLDRRFPRHAEASEWLRDHGAALRVTRPPVATDQPPLVESEPTTSLRPRARGRRRREPSAGQGMLF